MAVFGFRYQSATISTYNSSSSVRSETVTKPFSPFVPKFSSGDGYSDEYVGKKKLVPVGRRPYEYESDDEWNHERGTNPNPSHHASASPRKVDPAPWSIPVTSPHWAHSSQPKPYVTSYDNYDHPYAYNNNEGYKPKPKPTSTPLYADHGDYDTKEKYQPKPTLTPVYGDGYGADYGDYNNKERYKPKPTFSPVYNDGYGADYGDYNSKERYKSKPTSTPVYNDGYGADYGSYNNKEGYKPKLKPTSSSVYNDGYGTDDGNYDNKERYKPKSTSSPIYNDGYGTDDGDYNNKERYKPKSAVIPVYNDGYGADYGDYNNKEGYKPRPTGPLVYNDGYGADNGIYDNKEGYKPKSKTKPIGSPVRINGYGDDYGTEDNKERYKPKSTESPVDDYSNYSKEGPIPKSTEIPVYNNGYGVGGASPTRHDYGGYGSYPNNKEGNKPAGPKAIETPRKGTPLSKPTNNIDEAMELLKKEAAKLSGNERGYHGGPKANEKKPYYDGPGELGSRPASARSTYEKKMNLVDESEKLKKIATNAPETPTKGNSRFSSQRPLFNFSDGKRPDYGVIDHKEAERKFKGMTI